MSEVKTNKISSVSTNGDITLDPDGTGDVVVASGHKLGIGTAAPTEQLEISGTGVQTLKIDRTDASTDGALTINSANGSNYIYNDTAKLLILGTDNTERIRMDGSGNINARGEGGAATTIDLRQGSMKAWHYAHTNATFYDSFNLSSASDQGVGNFDFSFTNNMNNDDYSITCNALYAELAQPEGSSRTTSQYTIRIFGRQDSINNQDQYNSAQIGGDIA